VSDPAGVDTNGRTEYKKASWQKEHEMDQPKLESDSPEYAAALKSVRAAKNVLAVLIVAALVLQVAGFVMVRWVGLIDSPEAGAAGGIRLGSAEAGVRRDMGPSAGSPLRAPAATRAATQTAAKTPRYKPKMAARSMAPEEVGAAVMWTKILHGVLQAVKGVTPALCVLLALTLLLGVQLTLLGRLGGVVDLIGAFFWSLVLLAILMPWQDVFQDHFACGALYGIGELIGQTRLVKAPPSIGATTAEQVFYYARFLAFPLLALLVWITVMVKFASARNRESPPAADSS